MFILAIIAEAKDTCCLCFRLCHADWSCSKLVIRLSVAIIYGAVELLIVACVGKIWYVFPYSIYDVISFRISFHKKND